jgi:hypothetical protein
MLREILSEQDNSIVSLSVLVVLGLNLVISFVKFFIGNSFRKVESSAAYITLINQDIGLLKAAKDRAKEMDDQHTTALKELTEEVRGLRDKVIYLAAKLEVEIED